MRTFLAFAIASVLAIGLLVAQDQIPTTYTGKVTSVDSQMKTFTVETSSGPTTFSFNDQSVIQSQGRTMRLADLKAGDVVTVTATNLEDTNTRSATRVDIAGGVQAPARTETPGTSAVGSNTVGSNAMGSNAMGANAMGSNTVGSKMVTGRVTSVDPSGGTITVQTTSGTAMNYRTTSNTRYLSGSQYAELSTLKVGDRVRITPGSDPGSADKVEIMQGGAVRSQSAQLPKTASSLPVFGLLGVLLVGISLSMRAARRFSI